jgi:hypothetical protein
LVWLFLKKILFKNKSEKYKALGYFLHKIIWCHTWSIDLCFRPGFPENRAWGKTYVHMQSQAVRIW